MRSHGFERHIAPQPSVSLPSSPPSMDHVGRPALDAYTTLYTASSVCIHLQNLVDVYSYTRTHTGWFTSARPYLTGVNRKGTLKQTNERILSANMFRTHVSIPKKILKVQTSIEMYKIIFEKSSILQETSSLRILFMDYVIITRPLYLSPPRVRDTSFWITLYTCIHAQIEYVYIYVALGRMPRHPLPLAAWPTRQERFPGSLTPPSISSTATTPSSFHPPR